MQFLVSFFRNIIAILDTNGEIVVKYTYDAWGNHIFEGNAQIAAINPYRYRGYYYDIETGLYFLKTRYYDPAVGRFISMDDVAYIDPETIGGTNLFAYCNNNPVMNSDPTGKSASIVFLVIGIIATLIIATSGTMGGVSAYKTGGNVFEGIGKGLLAGHIFAGGLSLMTSSFYVPGGVKGRLGSTMFTYGAGLMLDIAELSITQGKKSAMDGDSFWMGTNDVINSIYSNAFGIVAGTETYRGLTIKGTEILSASETMYKFLSHVSDLSQYWKYSKAFKIGAREFWSAKEGFGIANYLSILMGIVDVASAIYNDPSESSFVLY